MAKNWVERVGGHPRGYKRIRKHLMAKGYPKRQAIAISTATVKKLASGRSNFGPVSGEKVGRWKANKGQYDAKRARAKAQTKRRKTR